MSAGAARLLTAARLAKQHSLPVLISGGQVFSAGASEALVAERILLQLGLPQLGVGQGEPQPAPRPLTPPLQALDGRGGRNR